MTCPISSVCPLQVNGGFLPDAARGSIRDGAGSYIHLADMWGTFCRLVRQLRHDFGPIFGRGFLQLCKMGPCSTER